MPKPLLDCCLIECYSPSPFGTCSWFPQESLSAFSHLPETVRIVTLLSLGTEYAPLISQSFMSVGRWCLSFLLHYAGTFALDVYDPSDGQ
jgi:hypothetical protein